MAEPKIASAARAPAPLPPLLAATESAAAAVADAHESIAAASPAPPQNASSAVVSCNGGADDTVEPAELAVTVAAPSDSTHHSATNVQEEVVAASDDSDAATDETGSASADEPPAARPAATAAAAARPAATAAAKEEEEEGNDAPPPPDAQRKRKRAKRLGFSSSRSKPKRNGVCAPMQLQDPQAATAAQAPQNGALEAPDSPLFQDSAALYPSAPGEGGVAWDWSMSDVYYEPLGQENLDQLERARKSCANIIAANVGACRGVEQETAQLAAMLRDASDSTSARVRPLRRGRHYRDVWEEEDFLHSQRKRDGFLVEKKRGFGDQDALLSHHELVHGYDDDLFARYISQLEAESRRQQSNRSDDTKVLAGAPGAGDRSGGDVDESKRKAKAPPTSLTKSALPLIPLEQCHPAAWGAWVLKNPTVRGARAVFVCAG